MTRQIKLLPARKPRDRSRDDDDSLLLRSAESLGRVIGALQRQLDGATRRLSHPTGNGAPSPAARKARKSTAPPSPQASARQAPPARKAPARRTGLQASASARPAARSRATATKRKTANKR
jgi:hypothetical protein